MHVVRDKGTKSLYFKVAVTRVDFSTLVLFSRGIKAVSSAYVAIMMSLKSGISEEKMVYSTSPNTPLCKIPALILQTFDISLFTLTEKSDFVTTAKN